VAAAAGTALPTEIEIPTELIRISRTLQPEDRGMAVQNAYRAYQHGDYAAAETGYRQVLASQSDNRDALLGLAAVAMRLQRFEEAAGYYTTLLRLRPRDPIALAALISLQREGDPVSAESRIKALIDLDPAAPYLHFALGNLYARQERWAEAQQAFFEAYRGNPEEPDYTLNLAVSLDKLNQPQAALPYYRKALALADAGQANFNTADVMKRIEALAATAGP
jgi:tetratricopeptide (TPR) repeat protein